MGRFSQLRHPSSTKDYVLRVIYVAKLSEFWRLFKLIDFKDLYTINIKLIANVSLW